MFCFFSENQYKSESVKQPKVRVGLSKQSDREEAEKEVGSRKKVAAISLPIPRYLNLEPSLAMDWLEISWDELRIKERVGAGIPSILHSYRFFIHVF